MQEFSHHLSHDAYLPRQYIHSPRDLYHFFVTTYPRLAPASLITAFLTADWEVAHHHCFINPPLPVPIMFRTGLLHYPHIKHIAIIHHNHSHHWEPLDHHLSTTYLLAGRLLQIPVLDYLKTSPDGFQSLKAHHPDSALFHALPFLLPPPPQKDPSASCLNN